MTDLQYLAALLGSGVAVAIILALVALRRASRGVNGPFLPANMIPPAATFHDAAMLASAHGILSHGNTNDRDAKYIADTSRQVADELTLARRMS